MFDSIVSFFSNLANDKKLHMAAGFVIALAVLVFTKSGMAAAGVAFLVGALKEYYDYRKNGTVEFADVAATTGPGLVLWLLFSLGGGYSAKVIELIAP